MSEANTSTQLEELDETECRRLLEVHQLGRLAINVGDQPQIFL
jgi:hypothetical protein